MISYGHNDHTGGLAFLSRSFDLSQHCVFWERYRYATSLKSAGILGGFHLSGPDERTERTMEYLSGLSPEKLYPCHCVSLKVKARMWGLFDVEEVGVGMRLSMEVK